MKILQVTERFDSFGVSNAVNHITQELVKRKHEVTLIGSDFGITPEVATTFKRIGNPFIPFPCSVALNSYFISPSMKRWLNDSLKDFDIVHLHNFRSYQNLVAQKYAKKFDIPYVLQAHGSVLPFFEKGFLKRIYDLVWGNGILKHAAKALALTAVEAGHYGQMGIETDRIEIVPNGIDVSNYGDLPGKGEFKKRHRITSDERVVLFLGRLHRIKGVSLLLNAFAELRKCMDDVKLVIVGPDHGVLAALKQQVKDLRIDNSVMFTGPIYGRDKLEAFVDAEVFVLPSIYETFPLTVLEAWACGTPVIVTDRCGIVDYVKKVGCVVEFDADELHRSLLAVLENDPWRTQASKLGRELALRQFSWYSITDQLEALYHQIVSKQK